MIAKSYLETKPAKVVTPVKLPVQYVVRGYHETSYTVEYDAGTKEYKIALSSLVSRSAEDGNESAGAAPADPHPLRRSRAR